MLRTSALVIVALLCTDVSLAQGTGSQIRGGRDVIAPKSPPQRAEVKKCESLRDEAKQRCIKETVDKTESAPRSGPESTGMGSGAGTSSAPR